MCINSKFNNSPPAAGDKCHSQQNKLKFTMLIYTVTACIEISTIFIPTRNNNYHAFNSTSNSRPVS